jgi:hypothetical protein
MGAVQGDLRLLIVAGTFVATFLIVCATAYFLLRRRKFHSDDAARPLTIGEKIAFTAQWLRHLTGADAATPHAPPPNTGGSPGIGVKVLLACVMIVVAVAVFLAVIAVALRLGNWVLEPAIGWVFQLIFPLLLTLEGSLIVAAGIIVLGLPLAKRFRRPERFRHGVLVLALAPATLWPLQYLAGSVDLGFREFTALLRVAGFFISATLFAAGLETMRRATNTPEDDSWEFLR